MQVVRSVIAVVLGYLVFAIPAFALFRLTGRDPHASSSSEFMLLSTVYGASFAALGGFSAAWLAQRWEIEHALAVSSLISVGGAISLLTQSADEAMWSQLAALLIMAPAAIVGGYIRSRQVASAKKR